MAPSSARPRGASGEPWPKRRRWALRRASSRGRGGTRRPWPPALGPAFANDEELEALEAEEAARAQRVRQRLAELREAESRIEARRLLLAREVARRRFQHSPLGRLHAATVLPYLDAADALRWAAASSSAADQVAVQAPNDTRRRWPVAHLRRVAACVQPARLVQGIAWHFVRSLVIDLASQGWQRVLEVLAAREAPAVTVVDHGSLSCLEGLSVSFPPERSASTRELWYQCSPQLLRLADFVSISAPLQELVLEDLRSVELLEAILRGCGESLRICVASFIGPESRSRALELPVSTGGLPALTVLSLRHRDFCEQRVSRQDRMMTVSASGLWQCLQMVRDASALRVLALAGIRVTGTDPETAALLQGLGSFRSLAALALRLPVQSAFGSLVPWAKLLQLRCSWPRLGYISLGDMSLHGFDYWPEQVTDFNKIYGKEILELTPFEVFRNEFRYVLSTQYGASPERQWALLSPRERGFWAHVARGLPSMPHSELRLRLQGFFSSGL